jgi:NAD-dependent deacetylase
VQKAHGHTSFAEQQTVPVLTDLAAQRKALIDEMSMASSIVAFTGAGISTEAGIPDFRSPGSAWTVNKPIPYDAFVASPEVRAEAWRRKFAMDDVSSGAKPATAHLEIAELVRRGRCTRVVTQNIDDLHARAGVPHEHLVELHGNGTYAACISCGTRHELADVRPLFEASGQAPHCRECGSPVKSATVSFGQAMPKHAMQRAAKAATSCDLFLVLGSSLVVFPAASFVDLAKQAGARLVIVNREPTGFDDLADWVLRGEIGPVMTGLGAY